MMPKPRRTARNPGRCVNGGSGSANGILRRYHRVYHICRCACRHMGFQGIGALQGRVLMPESIPPADKTSPSPRHRTEWSAEELQCFHFCRSSTMGLAKYRARYPDSTRRDANIRHAFRCWKKTQAEPPQSSTPSEQPPEELQCLTPISVCVLAPTPFHFHRGDAIIFWERGLPYPGTVRRVNDQGVLVELGRKGVIWVNPAKLIHSMR